MTDTPIKKDTESTWAICRDPVLLYHGGWSN